MEENILHTSLFLQVCIQREHRVNIPSERKAWHLAVNIELENRLDDEQDEDFDGEITQTFFVRILMRRKETVFFSSSSWPPLPA